jgi:hypothetical protein
MPLMSPAYGKFTEVPYEARYERPTCGEYVSAKCGSKWCTSRVSGALTYEVAEVGLACYPSSCQLVS